MRTGRVRLLGYSVLCVILFAVLRGGDAVPAKPQTTCPVSNKAVDKKYYADLDGSRIYFCSPSCADKFKKDPAKYLAVLKKQGVVLAKTPPLQSFCPPCNMTIDRKSSQHVDVNGYRLYSCSSYCSKKMQNDPDKYIQMIRDKGQESEPIPSSTAAPSKTGNTGKR